MRYGLLAGYLRPFANYGDFAQSMAIEHLYEQIGIPQKDIYYITADELEHYDGEELILPVNVFYTLLIDIRTGKPKISPKIKPVFISVTLADNSFGRLGGNILTQETLRLLQICAPIGCRDDYTVKLLEENDIPAYLQGCLTNALPFGTVGDARKTFFVDCPKEVLKYVPDEILRNATVSQNSFYVGTMEKEEMLSNAKAHYRMFEERAGLVVSSRYHGVTPCYAMGIPSIFVKRQNDIQERDVRLDTLNPYVPLYTWEDYSKIDWAPQCVPYERQKAAILKLAATRLMEDAVDLAAARSVRAFYEPRIVQYPQLLKKAKSFYKERLQRYISQQHPYPKKSEFYIWGAKPVFYICGKISIVDYMLEVNPNLVFKGWVDTYKSGELGGMPIETPKNLVLAENQFVVVAAEAAIEDAIQLFRSRGFSENQYVICVERHITETDLAQFRTERR